jgi:tetraspanin-33
VIFVVSFAGCVGALRENTCLLKFVSFTSLLIITLVLQLHENMFTFCVVLFQYSLCLLVFFLLEMAIAIMGFVFPHTMQSLLEETLSDKIIHMYREDADLQNFIDFAQQEVCEWISVMVRSYTTQFSVSIIVLSSFSAFFSFVAVV